MAAEVDLVISPSCTTRRGLAFADDFGRRLEQADELVLATRVTSCITVRNPTYMEPCGQMDQKTIG
jgi:hypothetical protein